MGKNIYNMYKTRTNKRQTEGILPIERLAFDEEPDDEIEAEAEREEFKKKLHKFKQDHFEEHIRYRVGPYGERNRFETCIIEAVKSQNTAALNLIMEQLTENDGANWQEY